MTPLEVTVEVGAAIVHPQQLAAIAALDAGGPLAITQEPHSSEVVVEAMDGRVWVVEADGGCRDALDARQDRA